MRSLIEDIKTIREIRKALLNEMQRYTFGDVLRYTSPQDPVRQTLCVFVRDDNGRAVVFFQYAEWAARVNYKFLSKE